MKWFYNMKIGSKLITSFIVVAIIAGVVGAIGIYNINTLNKNDKKLYENMTVPISQTAKMAEIVQSVSSFTRDMILADNTEDVNAYFLKIEDVIAEMNTLSDSFSETILSDEIQTAFDNFMTTRANYKTYLLQLKELCLEDKDAQALELLNGDMKTVAVAEQDAIDNLVQLKIQAAQNTSISNNSTAQKSIILMMAVVFGGMVIAVILGVFISRIIGGPLKKLSKDAELIADGDLNIKCEITTRDEVGALAASFLRMSDNLNEVITNISIAAEQVASGSRQVSNSSMALSQGATEQASSVEELSSSLEEISSQTRLNADNAGRANHLAETAKIDADSGNYQMKEMLKAMDEINDSSNNISKIIKVIDDIAFQTNILALNAAVEAARAGQHGKGFAVVAEEVRNLAARSAKAAKETTSMIESSIKKVDGGTKIANQTAEALSQIVEKITKVAALVGDIAAASNEQAAAISQINQGILQVSDVVQMNSATSQESAAASEELSSQSELLKDQVVRFKLKRKVYDGNNAGSSTEQIRPDVIQMLNKMGDSNKGISHVSHKENTMKTNAKIKLSDTDYGKY